MLHRRLLQGQMKSQTNYTGMHMTGERPRQVRPWTSAWAIVVGRHLRSQATSQTNSFFYTCVEICDDALHMATASNLLHKVFKEIN